MRHVGAHGHCTAKNGRGRGRSAAASLTSTVLHGGRSRGDNATCRRPAPPGGPRLRGPVRANAVAGRGRGALLGRAGEIGRAAIGVTAWEPLRASMRCDEASAACRDSACRCARCATARACCSSFSGSGSLDACTAAACVRGRFTAAASTRHGGNKCTPSSVLDSGFGRVGEHDSILLQHAWRGCPPSRAVHAALGVP